MNEGGIGLLSHSTTPAAKAARQLLASHPGHGTLRETWFRSFNSYRIAIEAGGR